MVEITFEENEFGHKKKTPYIVSGDNRASKQAILLSMKNNSYLKGISLSQWGMDDILDKQTAFLPRPFRPTNLKDIMNVSTNRRLYV